MRARWLRGPVRPTDLELLAGALHSAGSGHSDDGGLQREGVLRLATQHDLLPVLWSEALARGWYRTLPADAMSAVVARFGPGRTAAPILLQQSYQANRTRVTDLLEQGSAVLAALDRAGVAAIPLKGWHGLLAGWWPDPAWRVMRDLDVLVPEADARRAAAALAGLGYVEMGRGHDTDSDHELRPVHLPGRAGSVEIHVALTVRRWRPVLAAAPVLAAGMPMTATDAVTHLIAHAQLQDEAHLLARLPLRSLHELAVVSRGVGGSVEVAWDLVRYRFRAVAAEAALDCHLHLARVLFGAEVPPPRRATRALIHERLCRCLLTRNQWATSFEAVAYLPRALAAGRMHDLHGPGALPVLQARHVAAAIGHRIRPDSVHYTALDPTGPRSDQSRDRAGS